MYQGNRGCEIRIKKKRRTGLASELREIDIVVGSIEVEEVNVFGLCRRSK